MNERARNVLAVTTTAFALSVGIAACGGNERPHTAPTAVSHQQDMTGQKSPLVPMTPQGEAPTRKGEFNAMPSWEQNFSAMQSTIIDTHVWRYELDPEVPTYNNESQAYTSSPNNVRIEPGLGLIIEARKEAYRYPGTTSGRTYGYTSGRIDTKDRFSFERGKVEATMKLPGGAGTWAAMWFLSANQIHTSKLHPTSADWANERFYMKDGELDAMESYGHTSGLVEATAHTFFKSYEGRTTVSDAATAFHSYGVELTDKKITWTVDGKAYFELQKPSSDPDKWPFEGGNKMYLILNLAMGGSGGGPIDEAAGPQRLVVQDVKYFPQYQ